MWFRESGTHKASKCMTHWKAAPQFTVQLNSTDSTLIDTFITVAARSRILDLVQETRKMVQKSTPTSEFLDRKGKSPKMVQKESRSGQVVLNFPI